MKQRTLPINMLFLICLMLYLGLNSLLATAQIVLNPAVDTLNNRNNRIVIHTLTSYLQARFNHHEAKDYWDPGEVKRFKAYDLYEAHGLYDISFDEVIVLGITQPEAGIFKTKVLFSYMSTDKVRTVYGIYDYFMKVKDSRAVLSNALLVNLNALHYSKSTNKRIRYYFPADHRFSTTRADSANRFLDVLGRYFGHSLPDSVTYVMSQTCERLYALLGANYQIGTLSSSTTYCGYFDSKNLLIISSGSEYYPHELLRTLNLMYPNAPDILLSGLSTLWGGSANRPISYHLNKLYPYLMAHPQVLKKPEAFTYYDDETNPGFVLQAIVVNYILREKGKSELLRLMSKVKTDETLDTFLQHYCHIADIPAFFLTELKRYAGKSHLDFDRLPGTF